MPRKSKSSKSSKKKKISKSQIKSSENANVPERNVEKQFSDEGATASFQTENYDPKTSDDSVSKIYVYIDESTFECHETPSSLAESKERSPSVFAKSESVELFESSERVESSKSELSISISFKFGESPTRSESVQSPIRSESVQSPKRSEPVQSPTGSESVQFPTRSEFVLSPMKSKFAESPGRSGSVETSATPELLETSAISGSVESLESFRSESIELAVRSESVESSLRSKSVGTPGTSELLKTPIISDSVESFGSESVESPRTKSAEPQAKSESAKSSMRRILSEPILKSKLTDWGKELLFTQLMRKRLPNFVHLFESATMMVNYMEYLGTLRDEKDDEERFVNNRWKQNDASDWFDLLKLWDEAQFEIKAFMCVLEGVYEGFSEPTDISVTIPEFFCFIEDLEDVLKSLSLLLKRCTNSYYKYSRFCATNKETTFLKNLSDYRKNITCFQKKIQIEYNKFTTLGNLTLYG